jgi:YidC/Oxa1 family membrane protein insertase
MGLNLMETPGLHLKIALVIPFLAGFTQWMSTKIAMQDTIKSENDTMNATMNSMNIMMPLVSIFLCISLPIYMGIYWIAGSVARMLIHLLINFHMKKYSDEELVNESRRKIEKRGSKFFLFKTFYKERLSEDISWQQNHSKSLSISEKANLVSKYRREVSLKNEV